MQPGQSFNSKTVDWQKPGVHIDASIIPAFDPRAADIETFRRDGVVLLRGVNRGMRPGEALRADWFPILWTRDNQAVAELGFLAPLPQLPG